MRAITSQPCIAYPDYEKRFLLFCDASLTCIGACLAQTHDDLIRPIGYYSRTLSRTQTAWPIVDLEALSIVKALNHWRSMLMQSQVTAYTDNMAAKYILKSDRQTTARRARLVAEFSEFDNVILQHIAGKSNKVADFLSRIGNPYDDDDQNDPEPESIPLSPSAEDRIISHMIDLIAEQSRQQSAHKAETTETGTQTDNRNAPQVPISTVVPLETQDTVSVLPLVSLMAAVDEGEMEAETDKTLLELVLEDQMLQERLERQQQKDEYMSAILNYLRFGKFESSQMPNRMRNDIIREAKNYQVLNKLLYTKTGENGRVQLVVPKAMREQLIFAYHDSVCNAHRSAAQTFEAMRKNYYWHCMRSDIIYYVQNCTTCALVKRAQQTVIPPMHSPLVPTHPGSKWSLDFLERLVETPEGYKHVLVAVENTTTFVLAEPVKDLTAETVADFLYRRVFMTFGIANTIHCDNGAAFRGKLVEHMSAKLGAEITHSLPMHSRGNPYAERSIQRLQRILQMYTSTKQNDWAVFVPAAQHAMNTTVNRSLNESPFYLMFARDPKPPHAITPRNTGPEAQNNSLRSANFIEERARNYSEALHYALRYRQTMQSEYKHYHDRSQNDKLITVGARVHCKIARIPVGRSRALT